MLRQNRTGYSRTIQNFRGLAIIAVVFIHNTPSGLSQVFVRPFLNFSVGMFLFLSGMLSNAERWKPKKRIIKVVVPYVIWTFLYVTLIMTVLKAIPYYNKFTFYPVNALIILFISLCFVIIGKKVLGKYAKYLAM